MVWHQHQWYFNAAQVILWIMLVQTVAGIMVVHSRAQSQETLIDRLTLKQQMIEQRVQGLEDRKIPERLAVLEARVNEVIDGQADVRKLIYGTLAAIIGSLIVQIIQVRGLKQVTRLGESNGTSIRT